MYKRYINSIIIIIIIIMTNNVEHSSEKSRQGSSWRLQISHICNF